MASVDNDVRILMACFRGYISQLLTTVVQDQTLYVLFINKDSLHIPSISIDRGIDASFRSSNGLLS